MLNQKLKYAITALVLMLVAFTSCKKYETEPVYAIKDDLVWDETDSLGIVAGYFLNNIYTYLPNGFNRIDGDFLDAATDDAVPTRNNTTVSYYTNGIISVLNNPDPVWGNSYYGIRRANIYLKNIDRVSYVSKDTTSKRFGKAEARFLRAFFYFELLKRYGGVPLIGDSVFTLNDDLRLPRNSFAECVQYIVSECDSVKNKLRLEGSAFYGTGDFGKVPKGAALALKARVLLYAASPLYNGGGIETDPVKKALTGYPTYDAARWQAALDATNELIAMGYYSLYSGFGTMFTTKSNTEVIFSKQRSNTFDIETNNAPVGYASPAVSYGYTSPTQELVDAFPMNNGKAINESGSGYDATKPYLNRDPRLALTVFYNGYKWLSDTVRTYTGGKDRPGGNVVQTKTGYYLRKFMADFSGNTTYTNQSHNFIFFRYAEVLLNQAEALNELGRTSEAYAPLYLIRKRAGIPIGTGSYGLKTGMTQTEMRTAIQNERRIELAFEEHRFWDLRRWKLAETNLSGTVHGVTITRTAPGVYTYVASNVANYVFNKKLYHMPVPYSEVTKNPNLVQNEGW